MQMPVGELMSPNTMRNPNASHGVESYQLVVRTRKRKVDMPFLKHGHASSGLVRKLILRGLLRLHFQILHLQYHGFDAMALRPLCCPWNSQRSGQIMDRRR